MTCIDNFYCCKFASGDDLVLISVSTTFKNSRFEKHIWNQVFGGGSVLSCQCVFFTVNKKKSLFWKLKKKDGFGFQQSWRQPHWTLVGSVWLCCLHQNTATLADLWLNVEKEQFDPTAVCEEQPGSCGWVGATFIFYFFLKQHTLFKLHPSIPQSTKQESIAEYTL